MHIVYIYKLMNHTFAILWNSKTQVREHSRFDILRTEWNIGSSSEFCATIHYKSIIQIPVHYIHVYIHELPIFNSIKTAKHERTVSKPDLQTFPRLEQIHPRCRASCPGSGLHCVHRPENWVLVILATFTTRCGTFYIMALDQGFIVYIDLEIEF